MLGMDVAYTDKGLGDPEDYRFVEFLDPRLNSTRHYMLVLYGIIRANGFKDLVEIGALYGVTSAFLARAAKKNGGSLTIIEADAKRLFEVMQKLEALDLNAHVNYLLSPSQETQAPAPPDFVFIDGDHSTAVCEADWVNWGSRVKLGGVVAFHDTRDPEVADVVERQVRHNPSWTCLEFLGDCGLVLARRVA